jgi:hypothetical protein
MNNVLKVNKRRKDFLFAIQGLFEKGYWRLRFEINEEALRCILTSNHVTISESVWSNNHMLSSVEAASLPPVQTSGPLSGGGNRREIKPFTQFPPSQTQIVAIQHELDQPLSELTNKEIMPVQFADRLHIRLSQSKMVDNPLSLIYGKTEKFYQQDLSIYTKGNYRPSEIFFFNEKDVHTLSITQLVTDLTESEFHVSPDDLDGQLAKEAKIMNWTDRAANHEMTPSTYASY